MAALRIEHVNVMVTNPERTAALMQDIFGWRVRWSGRGQKDARTIHVGSDEHYIAFTNDSGAERVGNPFEKGRPLNHIGIQVQDLDATEARVVEAGLTPFAHGSYEPGRRFYFLDPDGIEYEVISYAQPSSVGAGK